MGRNLAAARINVKAVVILVVVMGLLGAGVVIGHYVRKRLVANAALAAGKAALDEENWAEACKHLQRYLVRYPDDVPMLKSYARANLLAQPRTAGNLVGAQSATSRIVKARPEDASAADRLASLYYVLGRYDKSAEAARRRLVVDDRDADAMIRLARAEIRLRSVDSAKSTLNRLIELIPNDERAYVLLSGLEIAEDDESARTRALEWLERGVAANPKPAITLLHLAHFQRQTLDDVAGARGSAEAIDASGLTRIADLLLAADEFTALELWDQARSIIRRLDDIDADSLVDPQIAAARFRLARFLVSGRLARVRGNSRVGADLAARAIDELPATFEASYLPLAIDLFLAADEVPSARRAVDRLAEVTSTDRVVQARLVTIVTVATAAILEAKGKPYRVIEALQGFDGLADLPSAQRMLWRAYVATDQPRRAADVVVDYVGNSPADVGALLSMARSFRGRDSAKVLEYADRILRIEPDRIDVRVLRFESMWRRAAAAGERRILDDVKRELDALWRNHPERADVVMLLAAITAVQGSVGESIDLLRGAVAQSDDTLTVSLRLVITLMRAGRTDEAVEVCLEAITNHPTLAAPRLALGELHRVQRDEEAMGQVLEAAVEELAGDERVPAIYALSRYARAAGDGARAASLLAELAGERPDDVKPRLALLALPETRQDKDTAERVIDEIRGIEGVTGLRWRLEDAKLRMRDEAWRPHENAIRQSLDACILADPGWSDPYVISAQLFERLGRPSRAEQVYRRGYAVCRDKLATAGPLLGLLVRQRRFVEAEQLLADLPATEALSAHRVDVAIGRGQYETAITELERRLDAQPTDAASMVVLARLVYHSTHDTDRALAILAKARGITPDMGAILSSRAFILGASGRADETDALLDAEVVRRADFTSYAVRANYHENQGRLDEAEKDFIQLTKLSGDRARGLATLAAFYGRQGRRDEAVTAWAALAEEDPEDPGLRRMAAQALLADSAPSRYQRGRAILSGLLKQFPDDPALMYLDAEANVARGTPESVGDAVGALEHVVELEPAFVPAYLRLIQIARARGETVEAEKYARQALGANPRNPEILLATARLELQKGKTGIARQLVESVIDQRPGHAGALMFLAELANRLGDRETAGRLLDDAIAANPNDERCHLATARHLDASGRAAEAVVALESFISTNAGRTSVAVRLELGALATAVGAYEEAAAQFDECERLGAAPAVLLNHRLRWFAAQKRFDEMADTVAGCETLATSGVSNRFQTAMILESTRHERLLVVAMELLERLAKDVPKRVDVHFVAARLAYGQDLIEDAADSYRRVLAVDPYHPQALNDLAWLLASKLDDPDEALKHVNRGLELEPDDPHLLDTRGVALIALGRHSEARADLERCAELAGEIPATRAHALINLARVHIRAGNSSAAREKLEEARAVDGENDVLTASERSELAALFSQTEG